MFSVTSEESFTLSTPGMLVAQLSKSPSAEFITEATEEHKAQMFCLFSVTSEESFTLSTPGMLVAQLSKSPSAEFITEATEEHKAQIFCLFSVTSEESFTLSTPGMLVAQLSKSPSAEFITEATEEHKAQMFMQESVFAHLSIEEKECILNVPAAKHLDDLQMFVRYGECSKISNTLKFLFLFSKKMSRGM